ncbi:transcription cofactor vestigial-like protein 4 isoform X1 [Artemia franciscana]|uniref:Transcription cofactor vestigial-like protein 4 n=1 Tax=Artemia franciscana TaxID=6661 RepID=A0AA88L5V5_ARTSF|nr:hypothetical protein QYM36_009704 [Artemia franciscana]
MSIPLGSPLEMLSHVASLIIEKESDEVRGRGSQNVERHEIGIRSRREKRKADWEEEPPVGRKQPLFEPETTSSTDIATRGLEDAPLDMSTTSRLPQYPNFPPHIQMSGENLPPYKRPTVITCRSKSPPPYRPTSCSPGLDGRKDEQKRALVKSCDTSDPVIDEHFRRSLGERYAHLFTSGDSGRRSATPTEQPPRSVSVTGLTVDDHFAKALGEDWIKLQNRGKNGTESPKPHTPQPGKTSSQSGSNPGSPMPQRQGLVLT